MNIITSKDNLSGQGGRGEFRSPIFPAVCENIARCCDATLDTTNLCSLGISCCVVEIFEIPEFVVPFEFTVELSAPLRSATI